MEARLPYSNGTSRYLYSKSFQNLANVAQIWTKLPNIAKVEKSPVNFMIQCEGWVRLGQSWSIWISFGQLRSDKTDGHTIASQDALEVMCVSD